MGLRQRNPAYGAMACVPILFGSYYIVTKIVNETVPLFWMISLRMAFALAGFLPFVGQLRRSSVKMVKWSGLLAFVFFLGVVAQAEGLNSVDAGKAGFISGLFIILTPLFSWLLYRTKINPKIFFSILITLFGLFIMFYDPQSNLLNIGVGELLNLAGATSIALHLVILGKAMGESDVFCIAFYQCLFMFAYSTIAAFVFKQPFPLQPSSGTVWLLLAYLGIAATTAPLLLQSWAQKRIKDNVAAVILSLEPVYATVFGVAFGHERLTWFNVIGGLFIMGGFILTVLQQPYVEQPSRGLDSDDNLKSPQ
jgi:drug/metabolite transporter (DMT)-like permease